MFEGLLKVKKGQNHPLCVSVKLPVYFFPLTKVLFKSGVCVVSIRKGDILCIVIV